jgi:hypothetical protein
MDTSVLGLTCIFAAVVGNISVSDKRLVTCTGDGSRKRALIYVTCKVLIKICRFWLISIKFSNTTFRKKSSSVLRTDRKTDMAKVMGAFLQPFVRTPKNIRGGSPYSWKMWGKLGNRTRDSPQQSTCLLFLVTTYHIRHTILQPPTFPPYILVFKIPTISVDKK